MANKELVEAISLSWCRRHRSESESTDWGQSLLMYGLLRGLPQHNNPEVREYIRRWLHFHLAEGVHVHYFCGSWSFALLYPEVAKLFPEAKMQLDATAEKIYDTIIHKALRNGDGVILHNVDLPNIYIDTVYYSAVLLAKLGPYLGKDWENEALKQLDSHLNILQDTNGKFYIHCQENLSDKRSEGSWARGNGWVMMTYAELLSVLPNGLEAYSCLSAAFKKLTDDLLVYQAPSGLWKTIIDEPTTYDEISASAMYLFAMQKGKSLGVLGAEYDEAIRKCLEGIKTYIDDDHRVLGVSEGTWPGTKEYYLSLSCGEWWWGTGAVLLALAEIAISE